MPLSHTEGGMPGLGGCPGSSQGPRDGAFHRTRTLGPGTMAQAPEEWWRPGWLTTGQPGLTQMRPGSGRTRWGIIRGHFNHLV